MDKSAREREEVILKLLEEKESLPDKEKDHQIWCVASIGAMNQMRSLPSHLPDEGAGAGRTDDGSGYPWNRVRIEMWKD